MERGISTGPLADDGARSGISARYGALRPARRGISLGRRFPAGGGRKKAARLSRLDCIGIEMEPRRPSFEIRGSRGKNI